MKTLLKIALISIAFNSHLVAQERSQNVQDKIETARIGMITNRLDLTSEQATAFWPVYNDYENKKMEVKKGLRQHLSESRSLASGDDKIVAELKEMIALRQKEVDIDKEYLVRFLKVISPRQVSELFKTEQMFKQMLLRRLENKGEKGPKGMK